MWDVSCVPELFPDVARVESEESRRGVKYFGPKDTTTPSLLNLGKRQYSLKVGHLANVIVVSLVTSDEQRMHVYFTHDAGCYAIHTQVGRESRFIAEAHSIPFHRQVKP